MRAYAAATRSRARRRRLARPIASLASPRLLVGTRLPDPDAVARLLEGHIDTFGTCITARTLPFPEHAPALTPATATATATVPDASRASLSFPSRSGLPHFPVRRWHGKSDVGEEKHIITAYGPDRPGLVSSLAKAVFDAKGNVENTRMARLGNDCNVMMLVSFANATPEDHRAFAQAADEIPGLTVKVRPTRAIRRSDADAVDTSRWRRVFLHGTDFPGLAYQMTSFLASNGINIEMMNTDTQPSPFGDDELFTIDAVIEIQPDVSLRAFKRSMDRLKKKLGVDIVISDHESHRDD